MWGKKLTGWHEGANEFFMASGSSFLMIYTSKRLLKTNMVPNAIQLFMRDTSTMHSSMQGSEFHSGEANLRAWGLLSLSLFLFHLQPRGLPQSIDSVVIYLLVVVFSSSLVPTWLLAHRGKWYFGRCHRGRHCFRASRLPRRPG